HAAMSMEQLLDEFALIVGPALAVVLATALFPEAGLIVAMTFYVSGAVVFLLRRETEPPAHGSIVSARQTVLRRPIIVAITGVMVFTGAIYGTNEVVTLAFAQEHGDKGMSGVLLGLFAFGSATSALVYGGRGARGALASALALGTAAMFLL